MGSAAGLFARGLVCCVICAAVLLAATWDESVKSDREILLEHGARISTNSNGDTPVAVDFHGTAVIPSLAERLHSLPTVAVVRFHHCRILPGTLSVLEEMPNLRGLVIRHSLWEAPSELASLLGNRAFERLEFQHVALDAGLLAEIDPQNLRELSIEHCQLKSLECLPDLCRESALQRLTLAGLSLTAADRQELCSARPHLVLNIPAKDRHPARPQPAVAVSAPRPQQPIRLTTAVRR